MEVKKITKEEYEKLIPWEKDIMAAYKNSFLHMTGSDFLKVAEIYKEITGTALTRSQMGCNTCRLNALRKLGEMYSNYKDAEKEKKPRKTRTKKLEVNNDGE